METINFDFKNLTKERLTQYVKEIKEAVIVANNKVLSVEGVRTFENTCRPLIDVDIETQPKENAFDFASNFYPTEELRDAGTACQKEINSFLIDAYMNKDMYNAFNQYYQTTYNKELLTHEERRYVEESIRDYKRDGLHLPEKEFNLVKEKTKRLSDLCTEFGDNINKDNTSFMFDKEEIDGMPDSWFIGKEPNENGKYKVTMKYPDYVPAIDYVKNELVRKQLFEAYCNRCADTNVEIFKEAIKIRYELAKLLGYENHADYVTEIKIVKNAKTAYDFLTDLNKKFDPVYDKERKELLEFAINHKENPLNKDHLDAWDNRFYIRAFKEIHANVNMEEIKKYFPYDKVRDGMFEIYQKILGLKFKSIPTDNKWHEKTELFAVYDQHSNELLGYFYFDMHPREGKYSHAAAFTFMSGCETNEIGGPYDKSKINSSEKFWLTDFNYFLGRSDTERHQSLIKAVDHTDLLTVVRRLNLVRNHQLNQQSKDLITQDIEFIKNFYSPEHKNKKMKLEPIPLRQPHVMAVACNFPETGCISFDDVQTFYHEFGHVMHQICSKTQLKDYAGLKVERDFVEAPSQMLELWCFEKVPLQMMSCHEDTKEPIPEELIEKIKKADKLLRGFTYKRQLMFGIFDLRTHMMTFDNNEVYDSQVLWNEVEKETIKYNAPISLNQVATFGHLMGGYDAGYYGYLISETFAANMFFQKFKGHELDPIVGMEYRTKILQPGSSKDGMDLLIDFLGTEPNSDDFLRDNGLTN
jgi:Zn-dependent oligopeptidase